MRRAAVLCFFIFTFIVITGLCQTAIDPEDFTGEWYSSVDQSIYQFRNGLIYCPKHSIMLSETDFISGAYTYCKNSIVLFAVGIETLEKEKELYLIHGNEGSFLCENKDGTGKIYFIRND